MWRANITPEEAGKRLTTDPHAPHTMRVIAPLRCAARLRLTALHALRPQRRPIIHHRSADSAPVGFCRRNMSEFHDAFGCEKGDAMWLAPEDRVNIW